MNNDLISRSALLGGYDVRKVTEYDESGCGLEYKAVSVEAIEAAPAVDAEPVRHGVWKPVMLKNVFGQEFVYRHACSICCEYALHECANYDAEEELSDYCPNCGAKMDAEVEDVD